MIRILLAAMLGLSFQVVQAHDTWLQPKQFSTAVGSPVTFEMTSASGFIGPETAIKAWRVSRAFGAVGGSRFLVTDFKESDKTLQLATKFLQPGVAVFCVDLKTRVLNLEAGKIEEYLSEIHAGPELRKQWAAIPEPRRWREGYTKHAKTFVSVGKPAKDDRTWATPLGAVLEVVPDKDPTQLKSGEEISVRVLRSGVPFPGFALGFVSTGESHEHVAITDSDGRAKAVLDVKGPWMIHGTDLRRATEPELEWESDFVTMVVEVKE